MAYVPRKKHFTAGTSRFEWVEAPRLEDVMCGTEGLSTLGELQMLAGSSETLSAQLEQAEAITARALKRMTTHG